MLQLILGYTFATLTGLLALLSLISMFIHVVRSPEKSGAAFIMFIICAGLSVFFAWAAGV